jgi:hypothetical protein
MKKRVPSEVPTSACPDIPKKTLRIDKVSAESTVKSGGIIISVEHIAKIWERAKTNEAIRRMIKAICRLTYSPCGLHLSFPFS